MIRFSFGNTPFFLLEGGAAFAHLTLTGNNTSNLGTAPHLASAFSIGESRTRPGSPMLFNRIFSDPNAHPLAPTTAYSTAWSPAGLVIRPKERADLIAIARTVLITERGIQNNRIVLDVRHWRCPFETDGLQEAFQRLANQIGITFWIRSSPQIFLEEIEPNLKRALDASKGPLLAMPGFGMGMHLSQSLRQEMRLELSLSIVMEQRQIQSDEREGFYDDLWTIERVPAEILQINDMLCTMARTENPIEYLRRADSVLDQIQAIREPYFRMMAICHLAEELKYHPTLDFYVKNLFSGPLTTNFNATPIVDQPTLALMVAASQVRVGSDRAFAQNLVTRAIGLAEEREVNFRGNDTRNLYTILSSWPSTIEEAAVAKDWVDRFVACEEWIARAEDLDLEAAGLSEERQVEQPEPEPEQPPARVAPVPTIAAETNRPLTVDENNFVTSRLLHRAMEQVIESRGFSEETFRILLELATRDSWEETAVVAYQLLAAHPPFRAGLRSALANFSSSYYRSKAAWVLATASGENPTERRLEVDRLLQAGSSLSESQLAHEHFILAARGEAVDPLRQLAPEGFEIGVAPLADSQSIQRWARDQVSRWNITVTVPTPTEVEAPALPRYGESQEPEEVERAAEPSKTEEEQARDKAKAERIKNRKGELYALIAKSLIAHHPDDPEAQKAAVELVCDSKSERATVFFLNDFPSNLTPEVRREVEDLVKASVTSEHLQALAQLFLLDPPQEPDKRARAITKAIGAFLTATSTDEKVSNAEAIADITWLARNMSSLPNACEKLLTMACKRLKLYAEKLKEPTEDESGVDERITDEREEGAEEVTDKQELWRKLYNQGQAHILASLPPDPKREVQFAKGIAKLKDPYLEAVAYNLRAHMLAKIPAHLEVAVTYMTTAIQTLSKIEQDSVRISLGMEILNEITGHPVFGTLGSELSTHLEHPFYASEARLSMIGQERVAQVNWYAPETVPQLILNGSIAPEVMGRFVSSKQLGKLLDRRDLTPAQKSEIMIGYLKTGAYQRAFEYLKPLMEAEEAKSQPEYLQALDRLFVKLLSREDNKAAQYLVNVAKRLF